MQLIDWSFSENYHILECWEMDLRDTRHLCRMRVDHVVMTILPTTSSLFPFPIW